MTSPTWSEATLHAWRKRILEKGRQVARCLEELLAGKEVTLPELLSGEGLARDMKLESRLRRYLAEVQGALDRIGGPDFGRCVECGEPVPETVLEEAPWTACCPACAKAEDGS